MRHYDELGEIIDSREFEEPEMCLCPECLQEALVVVIDEGIGLTEAWGVKNIHHDYIRISQCCKIEVYDADLI